MDVAANHIADIFGTEIYFWVSGLIAVFKLLFLKHLIFKQCLI